MAHVRQQVREAVGTLLSAAPTNWKEVFETRVTTRRRVLPYLQVFIESEDSAAEGINPDYPMQRDIAISVKGRVRFTDGENIEDTLDAMAAEIESTLTTTALNAQLGGKLKSLTLTGSSSQISDEEDEESTFAEIALDWQVQVYTVEGAPETLI